MNDQAQTTRWDCYRRRMEADAERFDREVDRLIDSGRFTGEAAVREAKRHDRWGWYCWRRLGQGGPA